MILSVIVLTRNREHALRRCVDRLMVTLRPTGTPTGPPRSELIIIDNGSTDGTRPWLEALSRDQHDPPLVVIHRPENEFVCARNHGIDRARGRFIAQVDDDVLVAPDWYRTLLEPMERDPTIGATGQDGFYQNHRWRPTDTSSGLLEGRHRPEPGQACDLLTGYCWAWRNDRTAAGARYRYDERFNPFWLEETDLQMQIRHAGLRIVRTWPVAVHNSLHDWTATNADHGPTAWRYASDHLALLRAKWEGIDGMPYEGKRLGL